MIGWVWLSNDRSFSDGNEGLLFCIGDPYTGDIVSKHNVTDAISKSDHFSAFYDFTLHSYARLANETFAMGFYNGVVRLWSIDKEHKARYLNTGDNEVNTIAPISDSLFATESNGRITVWRQDTLQKIEVIKASKGHLDIMVCLANGRIACVDNSRKRLEIIDFSLPQN